MRKRTVMPKLTPEFDAEDAQRLRILWAAHLDREDRRDMTWFFVKIVGIAAGIVATIIVVSWLIFAAQNGGTVELW